MNTFTPNSAAKILVGAGCGAGVGGGSDLVFRYVKSLALFNVKGCVTLADVTAALGTIDNAAALLWARTYMSGLEPNKGNARRLANFVKFIGAGGYAALASALDAIVAGRWFTLSETIKYADGASVTYSLDVRREVQNRFGLRLTDSRRLKQGAIESPIIESAIV